MKSRNAILRHALIHLLREMDNSESILLFGTDDMDESRVKLQQMIDFIPDERAEAMIDEVHRLIDEDYFDEAEELLGKIEYECGFSSELASAQATLDSIYFLSDEIDADQESQ
jgi:hypothetical protein